MGVLSGLLDSTLDSIQSLTGIGNYSASDSVIILANRVLEDYTKVNVTVTDSVDDKFGIHESYIAPLNLPSKYTITIATLPDSDDGYFIKKLNDYIRENGGYFNIVISNNTKYQGTWKCYVKKVADTDIDNEPQDEIYTFGGVRQVLTKTSQSLSDSQARSIMEG